ncbi:MAG: hypothetical protein AAF417_05110 [Pseudomonadota bacterium]
MHSENDDGQLDEAEAKAADDSDFDGEGQDVDPDETVVMSEDSFADPDISMEVNVEKLVAELESSNKETQRKAEVRRRLEELTEEGNFEDTYALDFADS